MVISNQWSVIDDQKAKEAEDKGKNGIRNGWRTTTCLRRMGGKQVSALRGRRSPFSRSDPFLDYRYRDKDPYFFLSVTEPFTPLNQYVPLSFLSPRETSKKFFWGPVQ
jgi:hypothetical protein